MNSKLITESVYLGPQVHICWYITAVKTNERNPPVVILLNVTPELIIVRNSS